MTKKAAAPTTVIPVKGAKIRAITPQKYINSDMLSAPYLAAEKDHCLAEWCPYSEFFHPAPS